MVRKLRRIAKWGILAVILAAFAVSGGGGERYTQIECLSFSSDGRFIAVSRLDARDSQAPRKAYKADISRTISVLNTSDGSLHARVHQDFRPGSHGSALQYWREGRTTVAFDPSADAVLFAGFDSRRLSRSSIHSGKTTAVNLSEIRFDVGFHLAVSPSGRFQAIGSPRNIQLYDSQADKLRSLDAGSDPQPAFAVNDQWLWSLDHPEVAKWDTATGEKLANWRPDPDKERSYDSIVALNNASLILSSNDLLTRYSESGEELDSWKKSARGDVLAASPDGSQFAYSDGGSVVIVDSATMSRKILRVFENDENQPSSIALSSKTALAAFGHDHQVSLFDAATGKKLWAVIPPGRYRWPWTYPAAALIVWGIAVWKLSTHGARPSVPSNEIVESTHPRE